jgi:hypothetical protein
MLREISIEPSYWIIRVSYWVYGRYCQSLYVFICPQYADPATLSPFPFLKLHIITQQVKARVKLSSTGLDRPIMLKEIEAPKISRQSAHECGKVFSLT